MKRSDITDRMVLESARDRAAIPGMPFITELLIARTGCPLKVAEAALRRTIARGLLDYGVSERTAWLTDHGMALLKSEMSHVGSE